MPRKPLREEARKPVFKVEVVPVEGASKMVTLDESWSGWVDGKTTGWGLGACFVRLRPPVGVSSSHVEWAKGWLRGLGCSVKVEPPRRVKVVPTEAVAVERLHAKAREVVEEVLAESRSAHKPALVSLVRATMDAAKL